MVNDKEYELVQDDEIVAGASGANAFNEIQNYAAQYAQDGPVEIYEVTRRKIDSAAAPQVVADERAAFLTAARDHGKLNLEEYGNSGFFVEGSTEHAWNMWKARAALAAAPVQAQEPVALPKIYSWGHTEITKEHLVSHLTSYAKVMPHAPRAQWAMAAAAKFITEYVRAPVQPVAVPDGDLREVVGKVIKAMESSAAPIDLAHALGEVSRQGGRIDFDADLMAELLAAYSAAPAAQGDAKKPLAPREQSLPSAGQEPDWASYAAAEQGDADLADAEVSLVLAVLASPGCKLSHLADNGEWKKPEHLGLIEAVGSYKWKPTEKLIASVRAAIAAKAAS